MSDKCRFFAFITYETDIEVIKSLLIAEGGDYLISPLHQPDDECKKPHYHVLYCHGNSTTFKCAKKIVPESLPANGVLLPVHHPRNMMRYFLHLDNPEKQQFPNGRNDLVVIGNFPLDLSKQLSPEQKRVISRKVLAFIRDYSICEYAELMDALETQEDPDLFDYAWSHTISISRYLDSRRFSKKGREDA